MSEIVNLIYEGKGKRLYATENPDEAVVFYRDETFAFHGLKRGRIIGKGEINNLICEYIFTMLAEHGVPNHFIRRVDSRCSLVKRVEILPVTIKVRNIAAGRLAERLGITEGTHLRNPVVELCLKNEELDYPFLNMTHITALNLATPDEVNTMVEMALKVNTVLSDYMRGIGIELIDFKLEFGRYQNRILLADEVSPDTCRFWDTKTHEPLDIDCFRREIGDAGEAYRELLHRMSGYVYKTAKEGQL